MNYDNLKLDNQLCFALYAASKEVVRLYKPILERFNITYTQYITMMVLWENDYLTVKEIGDKLLLDSNTLTPLLKKLECMDLLEKIKDSKDERKVYIKLKDKGIKMKEEAVIIPTKAFCFTALTTEEATNLRHDLKILLKKLKRN